VEVVTQFNGTASGFLKSPKTLVSDFKLTPRQAEDDAPLPVEGRGRRKTPKV